MLIIRSLPDRGAGLTKEAVRAMLPKVGDVRMEIPMLNNKIQTIPPMECVVIEVHREHLWYRVRFKETGHCESYKMPKTEPLEWEV